MMSAMQYAGLREVSAQESYDDGVDDNDDDENRRAIIYESECLHERGYKGSLCEVTMAAGLCCSLQVSAGC